MLYNDLETNRRIIEARLAGLEGHALELGRLCVTWGNLEMDLSLLLSTLAGIKESKVNNVILGLMAMREKTKAILAIGFSKSTPGDWYDQLSKVLNEIDNDLRTERNRMIHDYWFTMPPTMEVNRMQFAPSVVKEQAHQRKLVLAKFKPVTSDDVKTLREQIVSADAEIMRLREEYERMNRPLSEIFPQLAETPKSRSGSNHASFSNPA